MNPEDRIKDGSKSALITGITGQGSAYLGRSALITGITGQDGAYLAQFLLGKGYRVFGTYRHLSTPNFWRLQELGIYERVTLVPADLIDASSLTEAVRVSDPDEVYNLAAQSHVGVSFEQPIATGEVTGLGVARLLQAVREVKPTARFYQASTSELFGRDTPPPQNEDSRFGPASPYGAAKLYAYWVSNVYRQSYDMFVCNGILFNHESPLRGLEFVTRKISNAVARVKLGLQEEVQLGNLDARRDWGYAAEYVEAMWLMLQQEQPQQLVVATNTTHSVAEFAERAFAHAGLDWKQHVRTAAALLRPLDINYLQGDYTRAREVIGWEPQVGFDELVGLMVDADMKRWERHLGGESFPWDAPSYSHAK